MLKRLLCIITAVLAVNAITYAQAQQSNKKAHDYAPFSMIDGFYMLDGGYKDTRFDYYDFPTDEQGKKTHVEGHKIFIDYFEKEQGTLGSGLEVLRTIDDDAKSLNAQVFFEHAVTGETSCVNTRPLTLMTFRYEKNGAPVWVELTCNNSTGVSYELTIIEEKPFKAPQHASQSDIQNAIDTRGRATLHVNFDFNKATLRPDAQPVIGEVVGVLKAEPSLRLEVDGNTDGVGSDSYNQALSEERAKTVVAALVSSGVDAGRLTSAGFGASKPIADNNTGEGRAENRRVELIKK